MNKIIKMFKLNINNDYLVKKMVYEIKENERNGIYDDLAGMITLVLGLNVSIYSFR
jgi:hypothetical protein